LKKKLLIILGAGSSIPVGLPSVAAIDREMAAWSAAWASQHGFDNYYEVTWKAVENYYAAAPHSIRPQPNFEKVLGEMLGLAHWMTPSPLGHALRQVISPSGQPLGMGFRTGPYAATVALNDQVTSLLVQLATHMRGLSETSKIVGHPGFYTYRQLFGALGDKFDLGIFNLNYDSAALIACPGAFTGFAPGGTFDPDGVHQRTEWNFIYHLHGSVHHTLVQPFGNTIQWEAGLGANFFDGHPGNSTDMRSDNRAFPKTSLIAGGFKLDQLLAEPFHSFYAALIRRAYEADAILIGGYGFGDVHVNRTLKNSLDPTKPRPRVLVLTRASDFYPMELRADEWGRNVAISLNAPTGFVEPGHSAPPSLDELVASDGFEVSSVHSVAIWHGGFLEASRRLDSIVAWLDGSGDDMSLAGR
jgi:hypothetical protein